MTGQNQSLNYFVIGACQMLNLVSENKHHARKVTAILQVMTTWSSYIFAPYPKVEQYYINFFEYVNTYTFMKCTIE